MGTAADLTRQRDLRVAVKERAEDWVSRETNGQSKSRHRMNFQNAV